MSKLTGKTLKDIDDAFILESQKLLLRSGMFRATEPGLFSALPLGVKVIEKLENYIKTSLEDHGFQRILTSNKDFIRDLSMSIRNDIKSYKDLPSAFYDIQILERENIKIKEGLLRAREYRELRAVSYYTYSEELPKDYDSIIQLYKFLLKDLNMSITGVLDYNWESPQRAAHSFINKNDHGNRVLYKCRNCSYTALEEIAEYCIKKNTDDCNKEIEEIYTPDIKTIKHLEDYLKIDGKELAKTLLVKVNNEIITVIIRGDRELNYYKLSRVLNTKIEDILMAEEDEVHSIGTTMGFVGPVGLNNVKTIVDREVYDGGYFVTGANKRDYHIKNVKISKCLENPIVANISMIKKEDLCPICEGGLDNEYGMDLGRIMSLGDNTGVKNLKYRDNNGKTKDIFGIYHYIDIFKLLSLIVEYNNDDYGIIWPHKVSPYDVIISILSVKNEDKLSMGKKIYNKLKELGMNPLLDDRNERAGSKFNDADLLGIPVRIVIGKKANEGIVEFKERTRDEKLELSVDEAVSTVINLLK